ncbi:flavodoxin family protein [Verrucomicrobiota bacterium]
MKAILICGSRNPSGQTSQAVEMVLKGLTNATSSVERVFIPALKLEHCRQCKDNGWGLCREKGHCVIEDDFAGLVEKIRQADAAVFATPVYYSDLSESMRAFTDRLRRICTHEKGNMSIRGKPAVGVCVAGGGGGGAPACCVSLEKVLGTCGFDVMDMIPVRRQNLKTKLKSLETVGQWLAEQTGSTR